MHSPGRRRWLERALFGVALAATALLARAGGDGAQRDVSTTRGVEEALARLMRDPALALDVRLDSLPGPVTRAWLRAALLAGRPVRWTMAESGSSLAISIEPSGEPGGWHLARRLGPGTFRDIAGPIPIDTTGGPEVRLVRPRALALVAPSGTARAPASDTGRTRRVLVAGAASWEARFVAAALGEAGWDVESDLRVTDRPATIGVRTSGARARLDTANFAAVVLLDTGTTIAGIADFVRSGGGLVLAGAAVDHRSFQGIAPARRGRPRRPSLGALASPTPRSALPASALTLARDAIPVESIAGEVTVAARRDGLGRVAAVSYEDTWRWRMEGPEGAVEAHARWWSALVGSVASVPAVSPSDPGDPAPLAALRAELPVPASFPSRPDLDPRWLLGVALAALTGAWGSRRTRGLP